jgi:hypothetical protein
MLSKPKRLGKQSVELIAGGCVSSAIVLTPDQTRGALSGRARARSCRSAYLKYAVSVNEGPGGELIGAPADALATTANFLHAPGWRRGSDEGQPNLAARRCGLLAPKARCPPSKVRAVDRKRFSMLLRYWLAT